MVRTRVFAIPASSLNGVYAAESGSEMICPISSSDTGRLGDFGSKGKAFRTAEPQISQGAYRRLVCVRVVHYVRLFGELRGEVTDEHSR